MQAERPDPRRNAWRDDLAAESLRGVVEVPRYETGEACRVARAAVALRRQPDPALGLETEILFGETVTVYDRADGWAWVQATRDQYVGYVPADVLEPAGDPATHRVAAIGTFLYGAPDIKSPPLMHLSINSPLVVAEQADRFCHLATGGFVVARHVAPLDKLARDFVDVAERLIGVPYLWGGRTRIGVDCSGLVQLALEAAGLACPRDSDMQSAEVGTSLLLPDTLDGLRRGDLVFWPGHVGMMIDAVMLLHANAHHMAVVAEPLSTVVQRNDRAGLDISAVKRPPRLGMETAGF